MPERTLCIDTLVVNLSDFKSARALITHFPYLQSTRTNWKDIALLEGDWWIERKINWAFKQSPNLFKQSIEALFSLHLWLEAHGDTATILQELSHQITLCHGFWGWASSQKGLI